MPMSNFLDTMNKEHPSWKIKSTMLSKKMDYVKKVKDSLNFVTPTFIKTLVNQDLSYHVLKSGKNKGKVKKGSRKKPKYIMGNKESLTKYYNQNVKAEREWMLSRGKLAGLTTYNWSCWKPYFKLFHDGAGSGDQISTVGIKGYDKGTLYGLKYALIEAHLGLPLNKKRNTFDEYTYRQELNAWGLKDVKSTTSKKTPAKKTTTRKRKTPAKKPATRKRKTPAKKPATRKRKTPAKKPATRKRKTPAKKPATKKKPVYKGKRPSPSISATAVKTGTKRRGGSGKMYVAKAYVVNGKKVQRWVKA